MSDIKGLVLRETKMSESRDAFLKYSYGGLDATPKISGQFSLINTIQLMF
ncbi:TPA: hypothetical protein ACNBB8_003179 [Legionella pneumophila]